MGSSPCYDSDDACVYIHSYLSVLSLIIPFYWNSVDISDDNMKSIKIMSSHSFLICYACVLTPSDSSTTRPRPRAVSKGKPSKKPAVTILMMCELYSLLSLNCIYYLYRVCWNSANVLTMTWKASKACPGHYCSDLLCALCSHHLILAPPVPVHVLHLEGNHLKNQRFTILMMRGLYSLSSLRCIYYLYISCGIVPTSLTTTWKRQKHVQVIIFLIFSVHCAHTVWF